MRFPATLVLLAACSADAPYELTEGDWERRREEIGDLVLDAIATARGVTIDDTALDAEIDTLAKRQQQAPERIRAFYDRPEARHALRSRLGRDRTLSLVLAEAKVTAQPMPKDVARAG